jgi:hypothetical protein
MKEYVVMFNDEKDTVCASWDEAVSHTCSIISAFLSSSSGMGSAAFVKYAEGDAEAVCREDGIVCYATLYESLLFDDIFNSQYEAYPIYIQYRDRERHVGSAGIEKIEVVMDPDIGRCG